MDSAHIKDFTQTFFNKLQISLDELEVITEGENIFFIKIKTQESSLIIGQAGKNLEDIRGVLKSIFSKQEDKNIILHMEVNDYISKKEDKLLTFVKNKIDLCKKTGKEIILPYFNAYERKKIHAYVCDLADSSIYTKSMGEGEERRLHICKKSANITIDIDGIDI